MYFSKRKKPAKSSGAPLQRFNWFKPQSDLDAVNAA